MTAKKLTTSNITFAQVQTLLGELQDAKAVEMATIAKTDDGYRPMPITAFKGDEHYYGRRGQHSVYGDMLIFYPVKAPADHGFAFWNNAAIFLEWTAEDDMNFPAKEDAA